MRPPLPACLSACLPACLPPVQARGAICCGGLLGHPPRVQPAAHPAVRHAAAVDARHPARAQVQAGFGRRRGRGRQRRRRRPPRRGGRGVVRRHAAGWSPAASLSPPDLCRRCAPRACRSALQHGSDAASHMSARIDPAKRYKVGADPGAPPVRGAAAAQHGGSNGAANGALPRTPSPPDPPTLPKGSNGGEGATGRKNR